MPLDRHVVNDWTELTAMYGASACEWLAEYRRHSGVLEHSLAALAMLQAGDLDAASSALRQSVETLCSLQHPEYSLFHAWSAAHYRVAAYCHYLRGEYELAHKTLNIACSSVEAAISRQSFLLPLALECVDFCLNRARVYRNERRWAEMHRSISLGRGMALDSEPLCRTLQGSPVYLSTLAAHIPALSVGSEGLKPSTLLDRYSWRVRVDGFARQLLRIPGLAIEYPYVALARKGAGA
jgi:hypothetical protein